MSTPDSTPAVEIATRLYAAFTSHDRLALAALLHPDFTGRVSEGMPFGLGGAVHSPEQMLRDVWGGASAHYETAPHPDEYVVAGDNRVIVLGYYRGRCRTTGRHYAAAFAHDITVRDGKIASLTQITDTKPWHDALAAG
ncbi:nuclear transport factor 2 family protein [Mycolicibacterium sp. CBMA 226]|uniref:nuclear transport factor 2 family protein n=1 Tax=Mycolicibacterium sp. CBMA 226 TaxID=2606611 RepID=UPI0012DFD8FB|nr:nuclear transport factor 2 family protein [Mycolicibacterium sp. CBMA 226]MUL74649.1 hypothetical protein [Mycolicibacterium sp. CBMA 226]